MVCELLLLRFELVSHDLIRWPSNQTYVLSWAVQDAQYLMSASCIYTTAIKDATTVVLEQYCCSSGILHCSLDSRCCENLTFGHGRLFHGLSRLSNCRKVAGRYKILCPADITMPEHFVRLFTQ
eukprot:jgi/Botrbrau1/6946/Bobra.0215s0023.1